MKPIYRPKREPDFTFTEFARTAVWLAVGCAAMACSMFAAPAMVMIVFGFGG